MPQPVWLFDRFRLDTGDASLCRDGQIVNLAPKAFALLCCLAGRAGRLPKDECRMPCGRTILSANRRSRVA